MFKRSPERISVNEAIDGMSEHQRAMAALGRAAAKKYMDGIDYRPEPVTPSVEEIGVTEETAAARRAQMHIVPEIDEQAS